MSRILVAIYSEGNQIDIGTGLDQISLVKDGSHLNILNHMGVKIGTVDTNFSNQSMFEIKDIQGMKMGTIDISQQDHTVVFKDIHNIQIAHIEHQAPLNNVIESEVDSTNVALEHIDHSVPQIESIKPLPEINFVLTSILVEKKTSLIQEKKVNKLGSIDN